MSKFLCICLSAAIQKTLSFTRLELGKVNRSVCFRRDASGKAVNSARVLNQLESGCAQVICPLGRENSASFLKLAASQSLPVFYIEIDGFTRECWTLLDKNNASTTEIIAGEPIKIGADFKKEEEILLKLINDYAETADGILLSGSRPKIWSERLPALIARIALEKGKFFMADYTGEDLRCTLEVCTPSAIKINEEEFLSTFVNSSFVSESRLAELAAEKSRELKNIVIVTRGGKSTFAAINGEFFDFPAERVKAVNTTACGDAFAAGFLYEYINTGDFNAALAKGTWCAARNAELECPGAIR